MSTASIAERDPSIAKGMGLKERVAVGLMVLAAAGGVAESADASKKDHRKTPKVKVINYPDGSQAKIVNINTRNVVFSNKLERCFAKAEKKEQPAPPVDPYARCEGDITVNLVAKAVARCRKGWMGGRASVRLAIREKIETVAWARSIASGDAEAEAKTRVRDRIRGRMSAKVDCVKITPGQTPGTPTTPETPETPQIPPKDGTEGAGAGTPGQPGGPGAGGEAGDPNNGEQCINAQGDLVVGRPDQFGNC